MKNMKLLLYIFIYTFLILRFMQFLFTLIFEFYWFIIVTLPKGFDLIWLILFSLFCFELTWVLYFYIWAMAD